MASLDHYELSLIILEDQYPQATREQLVRGARWRADAPFGDDAAKYDLDPRLFQRDLEIEMFGKPLPGHDHAVTKHSTMKFNGGNPVFLCGHDDCAVIVCYAKWNPAINGWTQGAPYA